MRKLDEAIVPRNTRIRLDVGGQLFTVTMDMMTAYPDSFFGVLVSDRWNSSKDFAGDEVIFINRSAKLFSHILDFLRGDLDVVDLSAAKRKKLLREAHFYQVLPMLSSGAPLTGALRSSRKWPSWSGFQSASRTRRGF